MVADTVVTTLRAQEMRHYLTAVFLVELCASADTSDRSQRALQARKAGLAAAKIVERCFE